MTLLRVDRLTRRFGGILALNEVGFAIEQGSLAAVIGPNGAGKTTLFNIISGFADPTEGSVTFDGQDLAGLKPHRVAALGMARTFQLVRPFPAMSVAENVRVGMHLRTRGGMLMALLGQRAQERQVAERAIGLLDRVGLAGVADQSPGTLGYGQLRLLEIARALATEPRLLLLDEPAAGLNHVETDRLGALIRSLHADGMTILLIEHDMRLVMDLAQHVIVLDFGRKIADGPPDAVARDPAVLHAYLGGVDG
jgi:branched-chain amino acid transport system ATP-binding protein